ncbi:SpoIIE family protein phosphatase [Desulfosporosinus hippei]|uniref:Serine phosphatase RsbU, regulator of sigma subunit n=1 Tax=Desulfosporosinus hippei DSM 8344 TaxID=1121419 RepID=A0A1G7UAB3_9FIRM|nr:SpoIIE family protein phosphatase [Desulfosporosinus hippei]SDG44413.1 Serine phosphatase RsbU, regulator of sigma subunit [Desulfosporosinus hippei DSM 8344]
MNEIKRSGLYDKGTMWVIILACLSIALSMLLTGSLSYNITKKAVIEKLKTKDLFFIVQSAASKIDGRMARAKETSLIMAKDPFLMEWVANGEIDLNARELALKKLNTIAKEYDYSNTFLASVKTQIYWAEGGVAGRLSETNPEDKWFFETIRSKNPIYINIDYNKERKNTFVFIDALMGDPEQPIGVTGVGLDLGDISEELSSYRYGEIGTIWLVDSLGKIHLAANLEDQGKQLEDILPADICQMVLNDVNHGMEQPEIMEYENSDGELIDLVHQTLKSTDWQLVLQVPRKETIGFLQTIMTNTILAAVLVLVLITFVFYLVSTRIANPLKRAIKISQELERQVDERTQELKEQNIKIMDSIDYAKKLQETIIASDQEMSEAFKSSFVLWKPRDIVGGDFYWLRKMDNKVILAVADCTGHGVPGALMTMAVAPVLDHIVQAEQHLSPSEIIKELNLRMRSAMNKQGTCITDDGLDIGICIYQDNTLVFAGAKIDLYHKSPGGVLRIQGDRHSIGYLRSDPNQIFRDWVVEFSKDDFFYMTTDGFLDQNGGSKNHSFGRTRFLSLLEKCGNLSSQQQRNLVNQALIDFCQEESQRDDITVIGFQV